MRKFIFLTILISFFSCQKNYLPRPYGYFRVDMPENQYVKLDTISPYFFEISKYAKVKKNKKSDEFCIDIYYPFIDGTIYCTYNRFKSADFPTVSEESRTLAYKHTIRADAISESFFAKEGDRVFCILYDFKGNVASPVQFFITDSVSQYFRGSLYFNALPNADSIAPMKNYVFQDIRNLIETFRWK